ncbi:MAG: cbb3-type cytochrome c oxidase subunit I [Candidatus Zixiibacteriota bacterium]
MTTTMEKSQSWVSSIDSRRIANLYLLTIIVFLLVSAIAAMAMQLELFDAPSCIINSQLFGRLITHHGLIMVFAVLLPLLPAVMGNLVLPSAIGASDLAYSRLNLIGWICHLSGAALVVAAIELGAYDGGWTMLMPPPAGSSAFQLLVAGLLLLCLSTGLMHFVIAATILSKTHRTVPYARLPVVAWFFLIAALVTLVVSPIRLITLVQLSLHQWNVTPLFKLLEPDGIVRYQHLFWAYVGPVTYATILPAIGITLAILSEQSRTTVFARRAVLIAGLLLGQLSLVMWGQNLLGTSSQPVALTGSMFGLLSVAPMSVLILSWIVMLTRVHPWRQTSVALIWAQTTLLILGGLVGVILATPAVGLTLDKSYTATAHLHLVVLGGVFLSFVAGMMQWWPAWEQFRRPSLADRTVAVVVFVGIGGTYLPMLLNGLGGLPSALCIYPVRYETMHKISSIGSIILLAGIVVLCVWWFRGIFRGRRHRAEAIPVAALAEPDFPTQ